MRSGEISVSSGVGDTHGYLENVLRMNNNPSTSPGSQVLTEDSFVLQVLYVIVLSWEV